MPKRIIRKIRRALGDKSLGPDGRLVAAVLFESKAHHLHGNIYAFCGALHGVIQYFSRLAVLEFRVTRKGIYSNKVVAALADMQRAGFVRWNKRKDQLTILRDGPARSRFLSEVGKVPNFKACHRSIWTAGDQLCYFLNAK